MTHRNEVLSRIDIPILCKELFPSSIRRGVDQLQCRCPFHDDKKPSLSVNTTTGKFTCHGCGKTGSIIDLFMKVKGYDFKEAMQELEQRAGIAQPARVSQQKITGRYEYYDADGILQYWKERIEPGRDGRSKEFRFRHGEGEVKTGRGGEALLYNLPDVILAASVFVTEGEKQADLLNSWGLVATTLDSGAQSKLTPAMIEQLTNKQIIVLPDNDDPGKAYAERIAEAMQGKAVSMKVVRLPGLPDKGDVIEWAGIQGNDRAALLDLVSSADDWLSTSLPGQQEIADPRAAASQPEELRAFPKLYINTERLLNDPRRYQFRQGQAVLYDALSLRIAKSPGARFPNIPRAIASELDVSEDCISDFISTALRAGLLSLDTDTYIVNPVITEAYQVALETCKRNAENGRTGGLKKGRKPRRSKTI